MLAAWSVTNHTFYIYILILFHIIYVLKKYQTFRRLLKILTSLKGLDPDSLFCWNKLMTLNVYRR